MADAPAPKPGEIGSPQPAFALPGAGPQGDGAGPGKKLPIDAGLLSRIKAGVKFIVSGSQDAFMGPGNPLAPIADAPNQQTEGRRFDYRPQFNTNPTPKAGEGITFSDLRGLADTYDLMRLAIETRKDQATSIPWDIGFRDKTIKKVDDARIDTLRDFFRFPDRMNDWETWLRMVMEDMLVVDATCIYPRLNKGGAIYALEPVDGTTVFKVLDGYGRTPLAPDPAYQQRFSGMAAIDYTFDELIYRPRNLRTNKVYGFSPVEQVITTVNLALRRQLQQLSYYTEGNLPSALFSTPQDWNPDDIRQFQEWWDSVLAGQPKNKGRFIPFGVDVIDTKAGANAFNGPNDQVMNEWLARVICYCFNVSPTALTISNNRATSDTQKEMAEAEGLAPTKRWIKNLMDFVIHKYFGFNDLEFQWPDQKEIDPAVQATIDKTYLDAKVMEPGEIRERLGLEPFTAEQQASMAEAAAAALPIPLGAEQGDGTAPGKGKPPKGDAAPKPGAEEKKSDAPAIGKLEVHVHQGDTLVEMAPTTIKVESSDGKVKETRVG